jgi:ATP-dependent exoDNAse (exonuclease V) alpha subunit
MLADWEMDYRPFLKKTILPMGGEMIFALRWLYTALTRAKTNVSIIVGSDGGR